MTEKHNDVVALTLTFEDGSQLKHTYRKPMPRDIVMSGTPIFVWEPPTGLDLIAQLAPKLDKYLVWWRLEQESINLFRFLAWDGTEIWMIEEEELPLLIEKTLGRLADYEEEPPHA